MLVDGGTKSFFDDVTDKSLAQHRQVYLQLRFHQPGQTLDVNRLEPDPDRVLFSRKAT